MLIMYVRFCRTFTYLWVCAKFYRKTPTGISLWSGCNAVSTHRGESATSSAHWAFISTAEDQRPQRHAISSTKRSEVKDWGALKLAAKSKRYVPILLLFLFADHLQGLGPFLQLAVGLSTQETLPLMSIGQKPRKTLHFVVINTVVSPPAPVPGCLLSYPVAFNRCCF